VQACASTMMFKSNFGLSQAYLCAIVPIHRDIDEQPRSTRKRRETEEENRESELGRSRVGGKSTQSEVATHLVWIRGVGARHKSAEHLIVRETILVFK
jgi:hypothetical protein